MMMNPKLLFRLSPLPAAVLLAACSVAPTPPAATAPAPAPVNPAANANALPGKAPVDIQAYGVRSRRTLASLDRVNIDIPKLDNQLPANRVQLQRVGDLPATASTQPLPAGDTAVEDVKKPLSLDEQVNEKLNESLYLQILEQARQAKDPGTANAYLQVARKLKLGNSKFSAEKEEQKLLEDSVAFYQDLLSRMSTPEARADIYYDLAKTYDLMGKKAESAAALKELANKYPQPMRV